MANDSQPYSHWYCAHLRVNVVATPLGGKPRNQTKGSWYAVYRYLSCHIYPIGCNAKSQRKPEGMKGWRRCKTRLLLLEWYPEDQDCVNMLQGSSISSNSWHYMGRAFPNWLKYSRIRACRPLFRQSYCSHLSHNSYLLYTHTLFVLHYFILFGYFGCPSSSISTLPSLYLNI